MADGAASHRSSHPDRRRSGARISLMLAAAADPPEYGTSDRGQHAGTPLIIAGESALGHSGTGVSCGPITRSLAVAVGSPDTGDRRRVIVGLWLHRRFVRGHWRNSSVIPVHPPTTTFPLPSMVGCSTVLRRSLRTLTRSTRDGLRPNTVAEASFDPGKIPAALDHHDVEYILVGGLGARAHGALRPTSDIDCVPEGGLANLGRLARALSELGARLRVGG